MGGGEETFKIIHSISINVYLNVRGVITYPKSVSGIYIISMDEWESECKPKPNKSEGEEG